MPKLKTLKGLKRRVKVTGTGKIVRYRAGRRHLLAHKRAKTKRQMRRESVLPAAEARRLRPLIPAA